MIIYYFLDVYGDYFIKLFEWFLLSYFDGGCFIKVEIINSCYRHLRYIINYIGNHYEYSIYISKGSCG